MFYWFVSTENETRSQVWTGPLRAKAQIPSSVTKLPMPRAMLLAALLIELLGSLSLILGLRAGIAAAIMFAYMIPVTFAFHTLMSTNFEKNLGITGGLMMIAAYRSGIHSLSDRVQRPCSAGGFRRTCGFSRD